MNAASRWQWRQLIYLFHHLSLCSAPGAVSLIMELHKPPVWQPRKTSSRRLAKGNGGAAVSLKVIFRRETLWVELWWRCISTQEVLSGENGAGGIEPHTPTRRGQSNLKAGYRCLSRSFDFTTRNRNRSAAALVHRRSMASDQLSTFTGFLLKSSGWKMSNQVEAARVRHYRERWAREMVCNFLSSPGSHAPTPANKQRVGRLVKKHFRSTVSVFLTAVHL